MVIGNASAEGEVGMSDWEDDCDDAALKPTTEVKAQHKGWRSHKTEQISNFNFTQKKEWGPSARRRGHDERDPQRRNWGGGSGHLDTEGKRFSRRENEWSSSGRGDASGGRGLLASAPLCFSVDSSAFSLIIGNQLSKCPLKAVTSPRSINTHNRDCHDQRKPYFV